MLLRLATVFALVAGCAEPVVEMELVLPQNVESFDSSCVSAVTVYVRGTTYVDDAKDFRASCQTIGSQDRISGIHQSIRGKFTIEVPATGMSGIEIAGWSGPNPCDPPDLMTPDLIFHASTPYIGQDKVELKLTTTMDCAKQPVKLRPVEMFSLVTAADGATADSCAAAQVADAMGWGGLGQIMPRQLGSGVAFYGGFRGAEIGGGIAAFSAATTGLPAKSCLAYDTFGMRGFATSCVLPGGKVCAASDEYETPYINRDIATEALTLDEPLFAKWGTQVFVSVWDNGSPKRPVAGAKLELAADQGQVVYIDPPAPGSTTVTKRTEQVTGASGLAVVFTNQLANVKVTANGASRTVVVGAPAYSAGAAMVVMP